MYLEQAEREPLLKHGNIAQKNKMWEGVELSPSSQSGTHHACSSLSAAKHIKPLERAEGFFLCENGSSGNGAWGKQAVESILKALPPPLHLPPTPLSQYW